jgi:hypothetical protein
MIKGPTPAGIRTYKYPGMDFIASNISASDMSTGQEPKMVLRTSFFNGLHPFVQLCSSHNLTLYKLMMAIAPFL